MKSTLKLFTAIAFAVGTVGAGYHAYLDTKKVHYTYTSCIDWSDHAKRNSETCDERWKILPGGKQVRQYKDIRTKKWTDTTSTR